MTIPNGTPIIYKFQYFKEEYGMVLEELKDEPNIYIVQFPLRKNPQCHTQRILIDYLRVPTDEELTTHIEEFNHVRDLVNEQDPNYITVKHAIHRGNMKVPNGTVCAISHMELKDGEEIVIVHKNTTRLYSRTWFESYWSYTNTMKYVPRSPISNETITKQNEIERFTVLLVN